MLLHAPTDVYFNEESAFQADILFVSGEKLKIVKEDGIYGAPDLIVEILSPSTGYYDLKKKFQVYEKYGVREYFIIDPDDNEAVGYRNHNGKYHEFTRHTARFWSELLNGEIVFA
ncbi:MAG: Uma2 family endonuclease [Cytophagales bacterium]|nr:Uma2 family endonuclease [Cytophagales bacterium]